jgi:RND family efflux transporter MFP subunit
VTAVSPIVETVPIFLVENGETEAVEQAVVRARIRGIISELKHKKKVVAKGDNLFVIDPVEYEAVRDSAAATVNSAKAGLEMAESAIGVADARIAAADAEVKVTQAELDRMKTLLASNAVSQSEYDLALANLETSLASKQGAIAGKAANEAEINNAKAQIEKAEADLAQAQLNLDWTNVNAPIDGRITKTMVKGGNLVENGTQLIEIVKWDPIWVNFNITERFLLSLKRHSESDEEGSFDREKYKVRLQRSGDTGFPLEGKLDDFDPRIDQNTGTMQLRAVFENNSDGEDLLLPGMFVRVQVEIGQYENALLIPERAINRDQAGVFVYVVDGKKHAVRKNVTIGTTFHDMMIIESGLDQKDLVIVDGIQRVRPGIEVDPGQ